MMRASLVLGLFGTALFGSGCASAPAPTPPRSTAPAMVKELDDLACSLRPRPKEGVEIARAPIQETRNGKRHGEWVVFYPNGQRLSEGHYVDGLEHGLFKQWGADGRLLGQFEMKDGTGTFLAWCEDGSVMERREMKGGVNDGAMERRTCDGKPAESGQFVKGEREGEWSWFDSEGRLLVRERYSISEQRRSGSQYWPELGLARWDRTFVRDRLEGPTTWIDRGGHKRAEGTFKDGAPVGTWTTYSWDGKKVEEMVMDGQGRRHTAWDSNGMHPVVVEMDAGFGVLRVDGRDARSACLKGRLWVVTERFSDAPMTFHVEGLTPCSAPVPGAR